MPIDPVPPRPDPLRTDPARTPAPPPDGQDPGLRHESRQRPHLLVIHRTRPPASEPEDPEGGPDAPLSRLQRLLDEIETRLLLAPRDDVTGLQEALRAYRRLVEQLLGEDSPSRNAAGLARRRRSLLRELHRRLLPRPGSGGRRPPAR